MASWMSLSVQQYLHIFFRCCCCSGHCLETNSGQNNQLVLIALKFICFQEGEKKTTHNIFTSISIVWKLRRTVSKRANKMWLHFFLIGLLFGLLWLFGPYMYTLQVCVLLFGSLSAQCIIAIVSNQSTLLCFLYTQNLHTHTNYGFNRS